VPRRDRQRRRRPGKAPAARCALRPPPRLASLPGRAFPRRSWRSWSPTSSAAIPARFPPD